MRLEFQGDIKRTVTGRPYPLRGSGERPPDGLPQRYEAAS